MKQIKIIGLTKQMKELVKQHGDIWNQHEPKFWNDGTPISKDGSFIISTLKGVHKTDYGFEPFAIWVKEEIDIQKVS